MPNKYLLLLFIGISYISCTPDKADNASVTLPVRSNFSIAKKLPHDPKAFTQGLVHHHGSIIESTGLNGKSWISTYDPTSLDYSKKVALTNEFFGEGITILNNKIYQLTYKNRVGFVYDASSFEQIGKFNYPNQIKEGWGITHDNQHLIVSDGSNKLHFLDTLSYKVNSTIEVHQNRNDRSKLNELEHFKGFVYANVWGDNLILKIDPSTGHVVNSYDLSVLKKMEKAANSAIDVLNGITFDPSTDQMIVTGKYWPNYYYLNIE